MRTSLLSLVLVVALVLSGEVLVRALLGAPEPPDVTWPHPEMEVKALLLDDDAGTASAAPVLFAGSSVAAQNIETDVFVAATGLEAFNTGLSGAPLRTTRLFVEDVALPAMPAVETVVVVTTSWEFNDRSTFNETIHDSFVGSTAYQAIPRNTADRLQRWLEGHSALFGQRRRLRPGPRPVDSAPAEEARPAPVDLYSRRGTRLAEVPEDFALTEDFVTGHRERVLVDYAVGGHETDALRDLAATLSRRRIRLVVLISPIAPEYAELYPGGEEDLRDLERVLEGLASEPDITVVDSRPLFPSSDGFYDPLHLTRTGREELTRTLAASWPLPESCGVIVPLGDGCPTSAPGG